MIKTKYFKESQRFSEKELDEKINDFLEENNVDVIDIKLSRDLNGLCIALLIYKEKEINNENKNKRICDKLDQY